LAAELLQIYYGLRPAEATLASVLTNGKGLKDAADELHISLNTAKTHLRRIFDKTGTKRQAELVRLVLLGPGLATTKITRLGDDRGVS
jgi:DNA-binding CsgD family transcriptional regulator